MKKKANSPSGSAVGADDRPGANGPHDESLSDDKRDSRLSRIGRKILVLSGKGGVGKSTVAVNTACALSLSGAAVGLLDIDIHGPSVPTMLGLDGSRALSDGESLLPVDFDRVKVMSIGFLLGSADDAVIWRGPLKMSVIKQFLEDVAWGELDYLVIDSPPGTGDEPLSVAQLVPQVDGALVVTTPQEVALADVRKCLDFCRKLDIPVLGLIENMSGFTCPKCGEVVDLFKTGGGEKMALEAGVPFLGRIPVDAGIVAACDAGRPYVRLSGNRKDACAFTRIADAVRSTLAMPAGRLGDGR